MVSAINNSLSPGNPDAAGAGGPAYSNLLRKSSIVSSSKMSICCSQLAFLSSVYRSQGYCPKRASIIDFCIKRGSRKIQS